MTVLLVDRNDDLLDGLSMLAEASGLEVVGRARSAADAIDRVRRLAPDLVLMGAVLEDASGFETARALKEEPDAPIVLLIVFHQSRAAEEAARAMGADGCMSMVDAAHRLVPAIEACLKKLRN